MGGKDKTKSKRSPLCNGNCQGFGVQTVASRIHLSLFFGFASLYPILFSGRLIYHGGEMAGSQVQADTLLAQPPYSSSSYRLRGTFHCTKVGPVPIPPWSCKHPCPKPHGLKAMKGWVPTVAQGAGPGEEGRTAKAVSPLLCAMVSIKSHSSSSTTPPFLLYPAHNY